VSQKTKRYSEEFKLEAIKLAEKIGIPKAASELGVAYKSISNWIAKFNPESRSKAAKSSKSFQDLEAENQRLREEIGYIKRINEVLKKSAAILSADQIRHLK
jgi:transposase